MGIRRGFGMTLAAALSWLPPAVAQVGHPPGRSPYRDIAKGHTITALGGWFGGSGGRLAIAPHDGTVFGIRYEIRNSSPIALGLVLARADLDRLIVNPFVVLADRVSGPMQQTVSFIEADLQLNLTGGKTWRRLAPFAGAGIGLTLPSGTSADTSGFELGKRIYFTPQAGVRLFLTPRLHLRTEARVAFWKLKYPASFTREPPDEPGDPPDNSNAVITDGRVSEWSTSSWFQVGLGFAFSP